MNEETLGKRIARLRMERGWTQTDLGKKIEKAQSTIAGWETDARDKRPDIIELAHIFGVDAYYLKTGIETLFCQNYHICVDIFCRVCDTPPKPPTEAHMTTITLQTIEAEHQRLGDLLRGVTL